METQIEQQSVWKSVSEMVQERNAEIIRLVADGVTYEVIGERFHITRQRVGQIVKAHKEAEKNG